MKFKTTLTRISEQMIAPASSSISPTPLITPIATTPTASNQKSKLPVLNNKPKIEEIKGLINRMPNDHPDKKGFQKKLVELQQTNDIQQRINSLPNMYGQTPKLENASNFYKMIGRAYNTLNEAGPGDPNAAQPADAAMPQPGANQPPAAEPAATPQEVDTSGETAKLENDSNKIALIGIITRILNELLKHQNEVVTNSASDQSEKLSAGRRSEALKRLIDTTTSENLATSKLNQLLQHIQSQFNQIYPVA